MQKIILDIFNLFLNPYFVLIKFRSFTKTIFANNIILNISKYNVNFFFRSVNRAPSFLFEQGKNKIDPIDDVYFINHFKRQLMLFTDAIDLHRDLLHPTMLNKPNEIVKLVFLCNMETEKKVLILFVL